VAASNEYDDIFVVIGVLEIPAKLHPVDDSGALAFMAVVPIHYRAFGPTKREIEKYWPLWESGLK
jgi:hypothetical protein